MIAATFNFFTHISYSTYLPRHVMMYVCLCFFPKQKALSGCLFDSLPFERMKRAIINFKDIFVLHVMSLYTYENIVYVMLLSILVISFLWNDVDLRVCWGLGWIMFKLSASDSCVHKSSWTGEKYIYIFDIRICIVFQFSVVQCSMDIF